MSHSSEKLKKIQEPEPWISQKISKLPSSAIQKSEQELSYCKQIVRQLHKH